MFIVSIDSSKMNILPPDAVLSLPDSVSLPVRVPPSRSFCWQDVIETLNRITRIRQIADVNLFIVY